jgi:small subunit ribosomal protein S5
MAGNPRKPIQRRRAPKGRGKPRKRLSPKDKKIADLAAMKARLDSWVPKTEVGRQTKTKSIKNIDEILNKGIKIIEPEVVESLLDLSSELLLIGQSKGKFGGGQRRVFRQTQKKTREGNKPKFSTMCVVGDHDGHIGLGFGKAKETVPAREKAIRQAKLNVFKIRRGCGSWQCNCGEPHSVPFEVEGKCGSVIVRLMSAPKGKGLCVESEIAKVLEFAGIKDCWSKTFGQTKNRLNLLIATEKALKKLSTTKVREIDAKNTSIVDHSIKKVKKEKIESPIKVDDNSIVNEVNEKTITADPIIKEEKEKPITTKKFKKE